MRLTSRLTQWVVALALLYAATATDQAWAANAPLLGHAGLPTFDAWHLAEHLVPTS